MIIVFDNVSSWAEQSFTRNRWWWWWWTNEL